MLILTGFLENGKFIPDNPVSLPEKARVVVNVEEKEEEKEKQERIKKWNEIKEEILNCDEKLDGYPTPVKFRTPEEIDLL
jgi:predicted DNA-binding antitoxin AbrB/MazE fold protein